MAQTRQREQANLEVRVVLRKRGNARWGSTRCTGVCTMRATARAGPTRVGTTMRVVWPAHAMHNLGSPVRAVFPYGPKGDGARHWA